MIIKKTELYTIISTDEDKIFRSKIAGNYLTNKLILVVTIILIIMKKS